MASRPAVEPGVFKQRNNEFGSRIFVAPELVEETLTRGWPASRDLLLWVLDWVSSYETAAWAKVLSYLSVVTHFETFSKGVLDTKDLVFYVSAIFLGLFLTARSLESLRWRA